MKKLLSLSLALVLVLSALFIPTCAADSNEPTTAELEKVIKSVRSIIDVPEEYSEFNWNYSAASYYSESSWNLRWHDEDYTGAVRISCDKNGRIKSYSLSDYNKDYSMSLPDKSPDEMKYIADEFLSKVASYASDSMKYENTFSSGRYDHSYVYNYVRYENGIIVPDNTASVYVDYISGEVSDFSITYTQNLDFSSDKQFISSEKAQEILSTKQNMVLSYRLLTEYSEDGKPSSRKAYLVYTPETSYLSVDAITGEIYTERNTWVVNDKYFDANESATMNGYAGGVTSDSAASEKYELSEEEKAQLEVLEGLITKDEAIKKVTGNKYLYIDPDATAVNAVLRKDSYGRFFPDYFVGNGENDKYYWSITFTSASEDDSFYHYMNASVDAQDGTLLRFDSRLADYDYYLNNDLDIPKIEFDDEKAKSIADSFLTETIGDIYSKTRLSNSDFSEIINYNVTKEATDTSPEEKTPVYRTSNLNFVRVNEGIDFNYNNINVAVDKVLGKITSFGYNWYDDVEFESPKNIISKSDAFDSLYSSDFFGANYEINSTYTYNKYLNDSSDGELIDYDKLYETSQNSRAVYSLYNAGTTIVRASDGKLIDYSGEEYVPETKKEYSDISGHWAEQIINKFSYIGIGFDGRNFGPDDAITSSDFQSLLWSCNISGFDASSATDEYITRAQAVKYIISGLGYEKIAKLQNVFITDFADNMELNAEDVGYIAIARGFGIIEGDGETFRAYENLSRAEAMRLCYNVIENKAFAR